MVPWAVPAVRGGPGQALGCTPPRPRGAHAEPPTMQGGGCPRPAGQQGRECSRYCPGAHAAGGQMTVTQADGRMGPGDATARSVDGACAARAVEERCLSGVSNWRRGGTGQGGWAEAAGGAGRSLKPSGHSGWVGMPPHTRLPPSPRPYRGPPVSQLLGTEDMPSFARDVGLQLWAGKARARWGSWSPCLSCSCLTRHIRPTARFAQPSRQRMS